MTVFTQCRLPISHQQMPKDDEIAPDCLQAQSSGGDNISGVFGLIERNYDMRLRPEIVNSIGSYPMQGSAQRTPIRHIAVVQG